MRKTFIEAYVYGKFEVKLPESLPLMRKTFIEAQCVIQYTRFRQLSLPLMRKTFIEATAHTTNAVVQHLVSSAYAEDFH